MVTILGTFEAIRMAKFLLITAWPGIYQTRMAQATALANAETLYAYTCVQIYKLQTPVESSCLGLPQMQEYISQCNFVSVEHQN